MLHIKQFRFGGDNLAYVIYGGKRAMAVDGGAWQGILNFLDSRDLALEYVTVTHSHPDHTCGNRNLLLHTKAVFLDFNNLQDNSKISLDGENVTIMRTPGHSSDSVCFYTASALISGDTLFNGTIGNCFTGDLKGFYLSIKRLMMLPPETRIYAGHDYVRDALVFAEYLEPGNPDIAGYRGFYDRNHVCSTLAEELKINPYLRFNEKSIEELLMSKGLPNATELDRWKSLMLIV